MTKKQRIKALQAFELELKYKGWTEDRYGNFKDGNHRIKITAQQWREEEKHGKEWHKVASHPINQLTDDCAPWAPSSKKPKPKANPKSSDASKLATIKEHTTAKEQAAYTEAKANAKRNGGKLTVNYLFELNPLTTKKIEGMAFRQVQTTSQLSQIKEQMATMVAEVEAMRQETATQLSRIRTSTEEPENPVFATKCFNKITIKLRKRSVDVQVEDIHRGRKRRRIFRCDNFRLVEHLINYRTIVDGIAELAPPTSKRRTKKKAAKRASTKTPLDSLEETRYMMERDGIQNQIIPQKSEKFFDSSHAKANQKANRSRAKAEKLIIKLCSSGGVIEDACDSELIDALVDNGFDPEVAYDAAFNCGRVTNAKIRSRYVQPKKAKATHSNEY